ncbi:hypothetical protein [Streptomyces sp. NPDC057257]|uniref:hypothetical protein n=1 Tax=Streptomyces sp. NPDC057257 TaxID=3346071 RepID=UPI003628A71D
MATELGALADALTRATELPAAARRVDEVLVRLGSSSSGPSWTWRPTWQTTAEDWLVALEVLRSKHPQEFSELQAIAAEYVVPKPSPAPAGTTSTVTAVGSRSVAAGGDIGVAVTGDNATHVAGDHVDFRGGTFPAGAVGVQNNEVQNNYYGAVPAPAQWRPVGQVEPVEFGVHPTRQAQDLPDVVPYVRRDCDEDLRDKLAHSGLVLILGEPYAGKSYTAWQGVRSLKGHVLYALDTAEDLRGLLAALRGKPGKYVVWLDELTDHLGDGGLDPRLLGRLTGLGVVVLGTMSPDEYYRRRAGNGPGDRVVAAARTVELAREWSEAELERLAALDDPRAYPAYMWSGREGAASYFAVGPLLFDEWRRVGTRLAHPRGQLLVRAAVDLARCGVEGAVPAELLHRVQEQYKTEERESFEDALAWATTPLFGVSGLLVQGDEGGTWRAYGALVAQAVGSGDLEPVPDAVWWTLLDALLERDSKRDFARVFDAAHTALQPRIEAGDLDVVLGFARFTVGDAREAWLRQAAKLGHLSACLELAGLLQGRGNENRAVRYLEQAARAGSTEAAARLGSLLRQRAERWLRMAAEAGDGAAAHELGDMVLGSGRGDEALRWYRRAAAAGNREVAASLGTLLSHWRDKEAEIWLRYAADWGDARGASELGAYLMNQGVYDAADVERLFRLAAEAGDASAARNLGALLQRQGRNEEAKPFYLTAHDAGITYAEEWLARLLESQGNQAEAHEWFRKGRAANPTGLPDALPTPPDRTPTDPPDTVEE